MTGLDLYLMMALCTFLGAFLGALTLALCAESKRRQNEWEKERYSLTPQGHPALADDPSLYAPSVPVVFEQIETAQAKDAMETKARQGRKDRLKQIRAENPQAFQPVLTNPNDPTDLVL